MHEAETEEYEAILRRLDAGLERVVETIGALNDHELLETGMFEWAEPRTGLLSHRPPSPRTGSLAAS